MYESYGFSSSYVQIRELDHKEGWVPKSWCFWTMVLKTTLRVPWTARGSNHSILKEINPEYSLERLMMKLQFFGHLMQRVDSLEKIEGNLGKIEGQRRMRWLDSITNSWSLPNLCPLSPWCHPTISSSVIPFSTCPQSFPATGSFPMSRLFTSSGQSIGVSPSASVLPMNTQDWSPLGWTGWISLQSKGLSRVFSNTIGQKHQFFSAQLSLQSNCHLHTCSQG